MEDNTICIVYMKYAKKNVSCEDLEWGAGIEISDEMATEPERVKDLLESFTFALWRSMIKNGIIDNPYPEKWWED